MTYFNDSAANIATLAHLLGFDPLAAKAWLHAEGQAVANPTNPLNVRYYGRKAQTGSISEGSAGAFATYASATAGLTDAVAMLTALAPDHGYGAILAAAGSGNPYAQARAIELSDWAAGHYGATASADGLVSAPVFAQVVDHMLDLTHAGKRIAVPAGTPLYYSPLATQPIRTLAGAVTLTVVGEPAAAKGWYAVHVTTSYGWPDGVKRETGAYIHLAVTPAFTIGADVDVAA